MEETVTLTKQNEKFIIRMDDQEYLVRSDFRKDFLALHAKVNNGCINYDQLAAGTQIPKKHIYLALHRPTKKYYATLNPGAL